MKPPSAGAGPAEPGGEPGNRVWDRGRAAPFAPAPCHPSGPSLNLPGVARRVPPQEAGGGGPPAEDCPMPPVPHIDPAQLDLNNVVADVERIRRFNPQRFEMEQLTAVVLMDPENHLIAGYRDVGRDEFWVRGHMPTGPLMPGVLIVEAAAQLVSYYIKSNGLIPGDFFGFAGLEDVRFRSRVLPGDRIVMVGKMTRFSRRAITFNVQSFVGGVMVFEGSILGVPMSYTGRA